MTPSTMRITKLIGLTRPSIDPPWERSLRVGSTAEFYMIIPCTFQWQHLQIREQIFRPVQ